MKIGLFGLFGCGNSGNDASLDSMLIFLRRFCPVDSITCICPNPGAVAHDHGVPSVESSPAGFATSISRWMDDLLWHLPRRVMGVWYAFRSARTVDILIVPGTGFLDDFQDNPFGWPFMAFKWCLAAWIWRRKIFLVSIGAGPIRHPLSRFFLVSVARMASYRSYRDKNSWQFMQSLGLDVSGDRVYPDIVFSLPSGLERYPANDPRVVGVGVMSYFGWLKANANGEGIYQTYLQKLEAFIVWLLNQGYYIRLLTGDVGAWPAVEDLRKRIASSDAIVHSGLERVTAVRTSDLRGLMDEINETSAVVVTRYHNLVSALKLGRPAISIEYSQKNRALMDEMGLGDFCQHIEDLDLDLLKQQFQRMFDDRAAIRSQILGVNADFRKRLTVQEDILADSLGGLKPVYIPTATVG